MDKSPKIVYLSLFGIALLSAVLYLLLPKNEDIVLSPYPAPPIRTYSEKKKVCSEEEEPPLIFPIPDLSKELKLCSVPSRDNPSISLWKIYANGSWSAIEEGKMSFRPSWCDESRVDGIVEKIDENGVKITLLFPDIKGVIFTNNSFFLKVEDHAPPQELMNRPFIRELQSCKWWGRDRLKEESLKELRLQFFPDHKPAYLCKVTPANYLIYKDKHWQLASKEDDNSRYPIARFASDNDRKLQVWDELGNFVSISLLEGNVQPIKTAKESLFLNPKLKTLYRVTCLFDKTPLALHAGDLAEHKEGGWTILTDVEREKVLDGYAENDLFYFDGIKKEKGKKILCGYLMNGMRTLKEEIYVPLHQKKEQPLKRKKLTK